MTKKNEKNANLGAFKENVDKNLHERPRHAEHRREGLRFARRSREVQRQAVEEARSESGKKVVAKLLKDSGLDVDAAAYGEDWDGFKELVEKSDIKDKNLILQVLSLYNSSAERESEIKNMSIGIQRAERGDPSRTAPFADRQQHRHSGQDRRRDHGCLQERSAT